MAYVFRVRSVLQFHTLKMAVQKRLRSETRFQITDKVMRFSKCMILMAEM
jgi:hypothetical protein